jgi:hypothetical protein
MEQYGRAQKGLELTQVDGFCMLGDQNPQKDRHCQSSSNSNSKLDRPALADILDLTRKVQELNTTCPTGTQ